MASVPLSKDYLSSSTPIQQSRQGRNSKRFLSSPAKEIDALSPIKANHIKNNLFHSQNFLDKNCDTAFALTQLRRNKILDGVSRKLRFTELSNLIDVNNSSDVDNDSGIGSEVDISKSEDTSISDRLLSIDHNCNIINNLDDNAQYKPNISDILLKTDLKHSKSEILDNRKDYLNPKLQSAISNVDFFREINLRNCFGVISLILSHLDDKDIQNASCVNKEWRNIVVNDKAANKRRTEYITRKKEIATGPEKENQHHPQHVIKRNHKPVLLKVINSETKITKQPLVFTQTVAKFDSFLKEAENISIGEKLMKCPKCFYPSKILSESKYICTHYFCQHEFCKKCLGPYLNNHICPSLELNTILTNVFVGSKQSKKNLRRL